MRWRFTMALRWQVTTLTGTLPYNHCSPLDWNPKWCHPKPLSLRTIDAAKMILMGLTFGTRIGLIELFPFPTSTTTAIALGGQYRIQHIIYFISLYQIVCVTLFRWTCAHQPSLRTPLRGPPKVKWDQKISVRQACVKIFIYIRSSQRLDPWPSSLTILENTLFFFYWISISMSI